MPTPDPLHINSRIQTAALTHTHACFQFAVRLLCNCLWESALCCHPCCSLRTSHTRHWTQALCSGPSYTLFPEHFLYRFLAASWIFHISQLCQHPLCGLGGDTPQMVLNKHRSLSFPCPRALRSGFWRLGWGKPTGMEVDKWKHRNRSFIF